MAGVQIVRNIAINEHGLYLEFSQPFHPAIVQLAENQIRFSSRRIMIDWLYSTWPEWRAHLVASKGLMFDVDNNWIKGPDHWGRRL